MTDLTQLIDPSVGAAQTEVQLAPRPAALSGKVLGLLDNTKEQADVILHTLADALRERYGVAGVVFRRKEMFLQRSSSPTTLRRRRNGSFAARA